MCQVSGLSMESRIAADQDHQHELITSKEAAATAPPSSPSPQRTDSAHDSNQDPCIPDNPTRKAHLNVGDHDEQPPNLSFNLINSCSRDEHDCSPGSPEFFLPANAYISLDDPSSLLTSCYSTSPSDPNSIIWPNPISPSTALLNCPSIFSAGTSSDEGGSISCEEIPSQYVDINSQIPHYSSNNGSFPHDAALSYSALLQSHYHPAPLFHTNNMTPQSSFYGSFNQMMLQGSPNHPYCSSGSSHFAAVSQGGRTYPHVAAPYQMMPNVFAANTRAGMLEQCLNEAQHEQEEQSWYTFLQPAQENHDAGCIEKVDANIHSTSLLRGSTSTMMMPTDFQHHHHYKHNNYTRVDLCSPQPGMHNMTNVHHPAMETSATANSIPNKSHLMMESMQPNRSLDRALADVAVSCCTNSANKRPAPDGEDSWPPAEAQACSPPLKLKRSPSVSSSTSGRPQADHQIVLNSNHTHISNYAFGAEKHACSSCTPATLSPASTMPFNSPTKPGIINMSGSPTLSNNQLIDQQPQRKPAKSSTRQSVCNDPQSVAARHRRERISERLKTLQQLVPNGAKVDLVTMLEKAISYVKSLQLQVKVLSTDEYWPTPLSDKYSLTNLAAVAKLAASTYN